MLMATHPVSLGAYYVACSALSHWLVLVWGIFGFGSTQRVLRHTIGSRAPEFGNYPKIKLTRRGAAKKTPAVNRARWAPIPLLTAENQTQCWMAPVSFGSGGTQYQTPPR